MIDATTFGAERALLLMRILRASIFVLCVAGAGAAWVTGSTTALGLALVILAEEMWECSVVVAALRRASHGGDPRRGAASSPSAASRHRSAPVLLRHRS